MTILAASFALISAQQSDQKQFTLYDENGKPSPLIVLVNNKRLATPKNSPQKFGDPAAPWIFEYITSAFAGSKGDAQSVLRFRIYSQLRKSTADPSEDVAKMLLRLWDFNFRRLGTDHSPAWGGGIVDVYLCWGGKAGAEQRFDTDYDRKPAQKVSTIYFYDVASFTDPLQKARELAHEYGHATLPPIGGFQTPEDWANGYLGEKLYLQMIRDEMAAKRYGSPDAMGASFESIDKWVQEKVDPVVNAAALQGPRHDLLGKTGQASMDAYTGLAMYAHNFLGVETFARSILLTGSLKAVDYPNAVVEAVEERELTVVKIPEALKGKPIWVPQGSAKIQGGKVLRSAKGWAQVEPTGTLQIIGSAD